MFVAKKYKLQTAEDQSPIRNRSPLALYNLYERRYQSWAIFARSEKQAPGRLEPALRLERSNYRSVLLAEEAVRSKFAVHSKQNTHKSKTECSHFYIETVYSIIYFGEEMLKMKC